MHLRPISLSSLLGLALVCGGGYVLGTGISAVAGVLLIPCGIVFVSVVFERRPRARGSYSFPYDGPPSQFPRPEMQEIGEQPRHRTPPQDLP